MYRKGSNNHVDGWTTAVHTIACLRFVFVRDTAVVRLRLSHPDDVVEFLASVVEVLAHVGGDLLSGALHGEREDVLHHRLAPAAPGAGLRQGETQTGQERTRK